MKKVPTSTIETLQIRRILNCRLSGQSNDLACFRRWDLLLLTVPIFHYQFKRDKYWDAAYPLGVQGESTRDLFDLDESCFKLESQNRKCGKVTRQRHCDSWGRYKKGAGTISLLMAISGDERAGQAFSFHRTYTEGGTDQLRFYNYMLKLCNWLNANRNGRSFLFTMDNLNLHKHPMMINMIHSRGHHGVNRAPYWSCDGAIEYVFNTL